MAQAIDATLPDFEDALQAFAAAAVGATHLVTRDPRGFVGTPLQVVTPVRLLDVVASETPGAPPDL